MSKEQPPDFQLPSGLTKEEKQNLLIFETESTELRVDSASAGKKSNLAPRNASFRIHFPSDPPEGEVKTRPINGPTFDIPPNETSSLNVEWRERQGIAMEFIVIASDTSDVKNGKEEQMCLMIVETDSRGVSCKVQGSIKVDKSTWLSATPKRRVVFLV